MRILLSIQLLVLSKKGTCNCNRVENTPTTFNTAAVFSGFPSSRLSHFPIGNSPEHFVASFLLTVSVERPSVLKKQ